jgi:hypothetical protein
MKGGPEMVLPREIYLGIILVIDDTLFLSED